MPASVATKIERQYTLGEEIANSVTHGVGLLASIALLPMLVLLAAGRGDALEIAGAAVFGATLVMLYTTSTLYHAIPHASAKRVLRKLDHAAIYLLIAGTYTPFALGPLRGAWGWSLLATIWGLAALGVAIKTVRGIRGVWISTALYLAMGWLVVVAVRPLLATVDHRGLLWLLAGGLAYTGGVVFYVWKRRRYTHTVWHLFVAAGSACHAVAVWGYAIGR